MRKQWSTEPERPRPARGLPDRRDATPTSSPLMFSAVGGSMLIFAGAWPRMLPSDFRVRSLDGVADDWPLTYDELAALLRAQRPRRSACPGWAATRPIRPAARTRRCRRCRWARAGSRSPGRTRGSAGTGGRSRTRSCRPRTTAAGRASSAARASRAAPRAPRRRPTSPTGRRRSPAARGSSPAPACAGSRRTPRASRPARPGSTATAREHFEPAKVVVLAANAIGTPAAAAALGRRRPPGRPRELVRARRKAADDAPVRERRRAVRRGPRELAGPVRLLDRVVRVLRDGRVARLRARRQVGPRADVRADQRRAAEPRAGRRSGARTTTSTSARTWAAAPTGGCSARTCRTRRTGSRSRRRSPTRRHPRARGSTTDDPTTRGGCSTSTSRRRPSRSWRRARYNDRGRPADALLRVAPARDGADGRRSRRPRSLDRWNRTHDVPNLYVVDGSSFVTSAGVNPTSSICALALRAADHMVETRFEQQVPA